MKVDVDLALLRASFVQLAQTPFFRPILSDVADYFVNVIDIVIKEKYSERTRRYLSQRLWDTSKYLAGSATGDLPYEIEYCLSIALKEWLTEGIILTTLNPDPDFHFFKFDIFHYIDNTIRPGIDRPTKARLAPMSLPRIYRNHPVYCAPLYHELGHFIDLAYGIAGLSLWPKKEGDLEALEEGDLETLEKAGQDLNHRAEYFCDLFAAQYIGQVSSQVLLELAPGRAESPSHPATADRVRLIQTFLEGGEDPRIDLLNLALDARGLPRLGLRHADICVDEAFDDMRPVKVGSPAELHGLLPAAWTYLEEVRAGSNPAWSRRGNMTYPEKNAVINGLVEKSIRNFAITQAWRS